MSGTGNRPFSVWHEGELEVQERAGVRAEADELAGSYRRSIPSAMAGFLAQQQFAILSTADREGRVWAHLVAGQAEMIEARSANSIALVQGKIETELPTVNVASDQLAGLLVIDFARRIRVRINGRATAKADGSMVIAIDQFYGNCSKYIQRRVVESFGDSPISRESSNSNSLSPSQCELIHHADTFFISSRHLLHGADASHRGGKPGFVRVEAATRIVFPDYSGNNMFNTLGNIAVNPAVGLLFVDFESGTTLQVSGRATVDWDRERASHSELAQRMIEVEIEMVREVEQATSLRYRFIGYSPSLG